MLVLFGFLGFMVGFVAACFVFSYIGCERS